MTALPEFLRATSSVTLTIKPLIRGGEAQDGLSGVFVRHSRSARCEGENKWGDFAARPDSGDEFRASIGTWLASGRPTAPRGPAAGDSPSTLSCPWRVSLDLKIIT